MLKIGIRFSPKWLCFRCVSLLVVCTGISAVSAVVLFVLVSGIAGIDTEIIFIVRWSGVTVEAVCLIGSFKALVPGRIRADALLI
jgi:hypothetical protein